jgi:cell division protein FtsZ
MAPKNRDPREKRNVQVSGRNSGTTESVDLLEVGPDDDEDLLEFEESGSLPAKIKVIGVGGAGGNALDTMIRASLAGVEFVAANTDSQALEHKLSTVKLQLGTETCRGLGCGANPDRGRAAALEDRDKIRDLLIGSDMVFVAAGLGGGTGTGAAPVIAEIGREVGALTVAVVTKPFPFEGRLRARFAERGLEELERVVDTLITIPNQRLLALAGKDTSIRDSFVLADEVLLNAVRGISDLITIHGLVNLDFQDVRTIMNEMGMALMGTGIGVGDERAKDAAYAAISSPLLENVSIDGARGVLINITGGLDMTLYEVNEASTLVQEAAHEDANIIFGAVINEDTPEGEVRVTVIATGLDDGRGKRHRDQEPVQGESHQRPIESQVPAAVEVSPPPMAQEEGPTLAELANSLPSAEGSERPEEFVSPFEDELDVPTFLRRNKKDRESEEDRELPAFLRRSAD